METNSLRADCARCAALCCLALAFDRSEQFAIDKKSGEPCPYLDGCSGCRIHSDREPLGFGGCVTFDCLGAGQRVSEHYFPGQSWSADPSLIEPMSRAFLVVLRAHECLLLLREAQKLHLRSHDFERASALQKKLWLAGCDGVQISALQKETADFLSGLKAYVEDRPSRPVRSDRIR
ncbi:hypothetical protein WNY37_17380 [Henriciella sp. AS95]|uniref:hypothetical protein n=1 Tax=Henriciella sp. AS95 TaxID=3135782 RepID=UPI00317913D2